MSSRTLADLAQLAEEHPNVWLVPSTIIEGGIHVLHGKEESFKTRITMQLLEALNLGGCFVGWELPGGKRVGLAELEMTETIFKGIARAFMRPAKVKPEIGVLTEAERKAILNGTTAQARVHVLANWVQENKLDVIGIDSAAKLFPPTANIGSQPAVSDIFSQLQQVGCTVILIAHPRKRAQIQDAATAPQGNEEIAGSGRFAQDPDIVLEVVRPDRRSPMAVFSWGKNRLDFKPSDVQLFFDAVNQRLYPVHPFLHLLPAFREELIEESKRRFDWKRTMVDKWIEGLKQLKYADGSGLIVETREDRRAIFSLAPRVSLSKIVEISIKYACDTRTISET